MSQLINQKHPVSEACQLAVTSLIGPKEELLSLLAVLLSHSFIEYYTVVIFQVESTANTQRAFVVR